MEAVFLKALSMGLSASWLILAVLALRLLFRDAPKRVRCVLWAMVAVRLLCPVTPESRFSLVPDADAVSSRVITAPAAETIPAAPPVVYDAGEPSPTPPAVIGGVREPTGIQVQGAPVVTVLSWLWVSGTAVMLLYAVWGYLRLKRTAAASLPLEGGLRVCDEIAAPCVLGILRPRIYLPSGIGEAERAYIAAHEQAHIRRRDHWWKPLGYGILSVYWFHPLVWVSWFLFCRDLELACDESVLRSLDAEQRAAYSQALLDCGTRRRRVLVCPVAFWETGVKARVRAALRYRKPALWLSSLSAAACFAAAVCFLTNPVSAEAETAAASLPTTASITSVTVEADGGGPTPAEAEQAEEARRHVPVLILNGREPVEAYPWAFHVQYAGGAAGGDSVHPLQLRDVLPVVRRAPDPVSISPACDVFLTFSQSPDAVQVYCWDDAFWETGRATAETVDLMDPASVRYGDGGYFFRLREGGYVYEVTAQWKNLDGYPAAVCYAFYGVYETKDGKKPYQPKDGAHEYGYLLSWVSTDTAAYGLTDAMLTLDDSPDFPSLSLEALGAYFLHADGAAAESAAHWLYQRFLSAPDAVLIYLSQIWTRPVPADDAESADSAGETASTEDALTAGELITRAIAQEAAAASAEGRAAFETALNRCGAAYPMGNFAALVRDMRTAYEAALQEV